MRSSHEILGRPLAAKRFAQKVLPEPDMPTSAIRETGDGSVAMSRFSTISRAPSIGKFSRRKWVAAKAPTKMSRTCPSLVHFPVKARSSETISIPKRLRDRKGDQGHLLPSGKSRAESLDAQGQQAPPLQTASRSMLGGTCRWRRRKRSRENCCRERWTY